MKRNRPSVIRSSDSDRMMILEQHSYPSVSSTRITHLHRHLVQHDRVITAHYHLQFIDSLYRVVASRRRNTDFRTKGSRREPTRKRCDGTAEKWMERKMDEKSRRTFSYYARNYSVHETMTFSTVSLSSAVISARS